MIKVARKELTGKKVLICFLLFFMTVLCVDVYMIRMAIKTKSGLVAENSFMKGLDYNRTLNLAEKQKKMNVTSAVTFREGYLTWRLRMDQKPVLGAQLTATAFRPVQEGHDFSVIFTEKEPGIYEAKPNFPITGAWTVKMEAKWLTQQKQAQIYRERTDLVIP